MRPRAGHAMHARLWRPCMFLRVVRRPEKGAYPQGYSIEAMQAEDIDELKIHYWKIIVINRDK